MIGTGVGGHGMDVSTLLGKHKRMEGEMHSNGRREGIRKFW